MKNSFLSMGLIWKYDSEEPKGALIFLKGGGLEESKGGGWVNCLHAPCKDALIYSTVQK